MADQILATYEPATARMILEVVRYLQQSGFVIPGGRKQPGIFTAPPLYVKNTSDEEIPAYACMQSTGVVVDEADPDLTLIRVDKPVDADGNAGMYLFNGSSPIPIDQGGIAYAGPIVRALTDGSAITHGAAWGPVEGKWAITNGGLFRMLGADVLGTNLSRIYISGASGCRLFVAQLTSAWNSLSASAQISSINGTALTVLESSTIYDPLGIFGILGVDDYLLAIKQDGKYYTINAPCPS